MKAAIQTALEALEVGDYDYAVAVLLAALENGVDELSDSGPVRLRCVCPECGLRLEWPGLLDHHARFVHWRAEAA